MDRNKFFYAHKEKVRTEIKSALRTMLGFGFEGWRTEVELWSDGDVESTEIMSQNSFKRYNCARIVSIPVETWYWSDHWDESQKCTKCTVDDDDDYVPCADCLNEIIDCIANELIEEAQVNEI